MEKVLNFTVKDIQGTKVRDSVARASLNSRVMMIVLMSFLLKSFVDVQIKGWLKLTPEQPEQCIMKLQYRSPPVHIRTAWSS